MNDKSLFLMFSGKNRYSDPRSIRYVVNYICRRGKHKSRENELLVYGSIGLSEYADVRGMIEELTFLYENRKYKNYTGRYIYHSVFSPSQSQIDQLSTDKDTWDKIAREMGCIFFHHGFPVVYAVHTKDQINENVHIHFAISAVSFITHLKMHLSYEDIEIIRIEMDNIIARHIRAHKGA